MHRDFASEYAKRSDDEIRRLLQDRHNLVDEARDALDVEVQKRRSSGFDPHAREPEEPRLHVEQDNVKGNKVVVHSRELIFPQICPRCLSHEASSIVRIPCASDSSWGFFLALDLVSGLVGYLFYRYPVPFCRSCAISVRVRRWVQRLFWVGVPVCTVYLAMGHHLSAWRFMAVTGCLYLIGLATWMLFGLSKRWPPAGIKILSKWSARERRLRFANPEYEKAFIELNDNAARR